MTKRRSGFVLSIVLTIILLSISACSGGNITSAPPRGASQTSPTARGITPTPSASLTGEAKPVAQPKSLEEALANGKPTLAELGSTTCVYCLEMKKILDDLAKDYGDRINIVIIDVNQNYEYVAKYAVMAIPTQIFFDSKGNIVLKHVGLFPREDIVAQLRKMGVD